MMIAGIEDEENCRLDLFPERRAIECYPRREAPIVIPTRLEEAEAASQKARPSVSDGAAP
jgi:hypothetical protein